MQSSAHILVEGLVQGVGFRWFVLQHARQLHLNGFVRNLYDGNVEIEVEGDRSAIQELIKDVRCGPRASNVRNLHLQWKKPQNNFKQFEIR